MADLFKVYVEVNEDRLKALKKAPEIVERAFLVAADYYHTKILPQHFKKDAASRYDYARRSMDYLKRQGGKPALINSGRLRADMISRARFQATKTGITISMSARVLNLVPRMPENGLNHYVQLSNSTKGYPNIKRELKAMTEEEEQTIGEIIAAELDRAFNPDNSTKLP